MCCKYHETLFRGLKDMESEISSIEKRFAYGFLQKLLKWMEIAQEFIAHLGTADSELSDPSLVQRHPEPSILCDVLQRRW